MLARLRRLRTARLAATVAVLGGVLVVTTVPAAAATGPFSCNTNQDCEITAAAVPVGTAEEVVTYTCTAVTVAVEVFETGTSCFLAVFGTTTPVGGTTSLSYVPGNVSTLPEVSLVPVGSYWVCLQADYIPFGGGGPGPGPHNCSAGPI